jgi:hypothetical protein
VHRRSCPAILLNHRTEVLAVNSAGCKLFDVSPARQSRRGAAALTIAMRRAIAERCDNWETVATHLICMFKAGEPSGGSPNVPSPGLAPALQLIAADHPARVKQFAELWQSTAPRQDRWTGQAFPLVWRANARSRIRFDCLVSCLNTEVGLFMHNYSPADAKSHRVLEKLLAG